MKKNKKLAVTCPGCKKKICDGCVIYEKLNTNKQTPVKFPENFRLEKQEGFGISFDIGTTTLAGMLWNLATGELLQVETMKNPQTQIAADVISRIQYAVENTENLNQLQTMLVNCLDKMAASLLKDFPKEKLVKKMVMVGNTPMCELLMGISPKGIAAAPFVPDYQNTVEKSGEELGFTALKDTQIMVLPPIGGYVGSDALAVYHCVSTQQAGKCQQQKARQDGVGTDSEVIMAVDIGTNGEMILKAGDKSFVCSAAAGPALEGGAISQGMRASKGAIEKVRALGSFPVQDIIYNVIGDEKPIGICGSGLIDAAAVLYRLGVVDETGYLRTQQEARAIGVPEKVCRRLTVRDVNAGKADDVQTGGMQNENCFLLTNAEVPIYLTAGDIRQLQLSMGAIRAGMEVLLAKAGIKATDISRFYIAGAFGSYIDISSGTAIGLFPDIPAEKVIQAGNLASTGAAMALLSDAELKKLEAEAKQLIHVELAEEKAFEKLFLQHMNFPLLFYTSMI